MVALLIAVTAGVLMLIVLLAGRGVLDFLGVSLEAFRIAGGVLLLLIGISMTRGDTGSGVRDATEQAQLTNLAMAESVYRAIVVPMAMPLLVGPGVIAYIILHASEAEAAKQDVHVLDIGVGIGVVSLLCFVILWGGRAIKRLLGDVGLNILTRVMGLLVAAIGVQFIVTGTTQVFLTTIVPEMHKLP